MAHHVETFVYSPLLVQHPNPIRLVRLHPPALPGEIECELIQVSMNSKPQYEALSYEWGPTSSTHFWVTIDGSQFEIRENLWRALRCLRPDKEPRLLWIDALCINQEDTVERQNQVTKMGEIYNMAKRVVVWVGPELEPIIGSKTAKRDDTLIALSFLEDTKRKSIRDFMPSKKTPLKLKGHDQTWMALLNFCQRSYWTRLWIIQEVVLANKVIIQVGEMKVTWGVLSQLFSELDEHCKDEGQLFKFGEALRNSIPAKLDQQRLVRMKREQEGSPVLDMIFLNENSMCTDIRDKIWGMHSLVKPCCREALPIDYVSSPIELCARVLHHDFLHHRPKIYQFVRSAQRLLKILLDDGAPADKWEERRDILTLMDTTTLYNLAPQSDSTNSVNKFPEYKESTSLQLTGRVRGPITWFGSQYLYTHGSRTWNVNSLDPYKTYDKSRLAQPGLVELLDQREWSYPPPSEKIRAVIATFDQAGTVTPRCSSVSSSESHASIPSRDRQSTTGTPQARKRSISDTLSRLTIRSPTLLSLPDIEKEKCEPAAPITTRQRSHSGSKWTKYRAKLPNDANGDRLLGLDNGLLAFAPKDAKVGDLVCQFKECDFFVIIRESEGKNNVFDIVGTAGVVRKPGGDDLSKQERVVLDLDIVTLLKLCWNFPYKNKD